MTRATRRAKESQGGLPYSLRIGFLTTAVFHRRTSAVEFTWGKSGSGSRAVVRRRGRSQDRRCVCCYQRPCAKSEERRAEANEPGAVSEAKAQ
jgi:hypothetical protein